jgi:hypothetical protein
MSDRRRRALNRLMEWRWRRGQITFQAFDWWLRTISGV